MYVIREGVQVPHFVKVSSGCAGATEHAQATMEGPFICQLCGDGFVTTHDLWKHAENSTTRGWSVESDSSSKSSS